MNIEGPVRWIWAELLLPVVLVINSEFVSMYPFHMFCMLALIPLILLMFESVAVIFTALTFTGENVVVVKTVIEAFVALIESVDMWLTLIFVVVYIKSLDGKFP